MKFSLFALVLVALACFARATTYQAIPNQFQNKHIAGVDIQTMVAGNQNDCLKEACGHIRANAVAYCSHASGCSTGAKQYSCVLKHVDDIYNPEDFSSTGQPSHTWVSSTVDKKICASQFGRRLAAL